MQKEIVILTKSTKNGGYCISGIDLSNGKWIRPISEDINRGGAVPYCDILYQDKSEIEVFDIVRMDFIQDKPTICQPENCIYDPSVYWTKIGKMSLEEVIKLRGTDLPEKIFYNFDKEVSTEEIGGESSLILAEVQNSYIFIKTFDAGNRKVQFNFTYNGEDYRFFKVSDERVKERTENYLDGSYFFKDKNWVIFSLTDIFAPTNKYYKMVPQIFY